MIKIYIYPIFLLDSTLSPNDTSKYHCYLDERLPSLEDICNKLISNLENYSKDNNIFGISFHVSDGTESPGELVDKGNSIVLISPFLKSLIPHTNSNKEIYLTVNEFFSESLDRLYKILYGLKNNRNI